MILGIAEVKKAIGENKEATEMGKKQSGSEKTSYIPPRNHLFYIFDYENMSVTRNIQLFHYLS